MLRIALINQITLTHQYDDSYQLLINLKITLNTHSGISTVKAEMKAEQIITKELIF